MVRIRRLSFAYTAGIAARTERRFEQIRCIHHRYGADCGLSGFLGVAHGYAAVLRPMPQWTFLDPNGKLESCRFLRRHEPRLYELVGGLVTNDFLHGTVHEASDDLQAAVRSNPTTLTLWELLTPLGRNEFICWVDDAKQAKTRQRRIERTCEELLEGKKRPCCWAGCIHRTDKKPSPWQQAVLIGGRGRNRP